MSRLQELDEAARRRMPKQLYIPLPCEAARGQMLDRGLGAIAEPKHIPLYPKALKKLNISLPCKVARGQMLDRGLGAMIKP